MPKLKKGSSNGCYHRILALGRDRIGDCVDWRAFFFAPYTAAAGYGVSVGHDARWDAYLSAKAIRDIASGLFTAILILNRSVHLLGWFMLVAAIIPLTDAVIVLRHGGTQAAAFGIHGATAGVMLIISGLLLLG
ncbi:MAG: DUF4267 domain-containing protein [Methylocella sp.]